MAEVQLLAEEQLVRLGEPLVEEHLVPQEEQAQQEVSPMEMVMLQGERLVLKEETVCREHLMEEAEVQLILAEVQPIG